MNSYLDQQPSYIVDQFKLIELDDELTSPLSDSDMADVMGWSDVKS